MPDAPRLPGPVVLAYSGGLDTSFCIPWLREHQGAPVVTVTVDTGGLDDAARAELATRSAALGAERHVLVDARHAFWDGTLRFLLFGNVLRGHLYPLCVGAERALQARLVAAEAQALGASAVAHGCTAAGNDQVRFEIALRTLAPGLPILAPVRDGGFQRADEVAFLAARGVDWPAERAPYSINAGLWGVTIGGRETSGTAESLPEPAWVLTRGAFDAPREPRALAIDFDRGVPIALDGRPSDPVALVETLNAAAGAFGIGRGIHLGDTILGVKGRVAFEAPAATLLIAAHRELEKLVQTARQQRVKDSLAAVYGDLVHEGQVLDPAARDIEALFERSQERVTGRVTLQLRPGAAFVTGVVSPFSLAAASRTVYGEAAAEWTAEDARGFARLLALPSMLAARAGGGGA